MGVACFKRCVQTSAMVSCDLILKIYVSVPISERTFKVVSVEFEGGEGGQGVFNLLDNEYCIQRVCVCVCVCDRP